MKHPCLFPLLVGAGILLGGADLPSARASGSGTKSLPAFAAKARPRVASRSAHPHRSLRPAATAIRSVKQAMRATVEPSAGGFVNAVQVYPFAEGVVYRVYTAPGQITDIALQPGEALAAVASGDTVRWVIGDTTSGTGGARQTHVLVKPIAAGLSTNLVITTDRRSYHVALSSLATAAMAAISWNYPQDQLLAIQSAAQKAEAASPVAADLDLTQLHFGYRITGASPAWRPLRAFDDGRQTFIEFPATLGTGEAPPLFVVDGKGDVQLVNYRLRGHFYVIDRLFDAAELRLGLKHQDVVRIERTGERAPGRGA